MSRGDNGQITNDYFDKKPLKKSLTTTVGSGNGGWGSRGSMYAAPGTRRYWYDDDQLYSYEMPLICRIQHDGKDFYILNGDGAPSMKTAEHQRTLRGGVDRKVPREQWAIIPYSALRNAGIQAWDVELIATTPDREIERWEVCRSTKCGGLKGHWDKENVRKKGSDEHEVRHTTHYLGETLFKAKGKYYVCGLDRNDDPSRRMFYLAEIPAAKKAPKTVDEALDMLRPKFLDPEAPRQGEWFFEPAEFEKDPLLMTKEEWRKLLMTKEDFTVHIDRTKYYKLTAEEQKEAEKRSAGYRHRPFRANSGRQYAQSLKERHNHYASLDERSDERRHYAPVIIRLRFKDRVRMYVRGTIRDAEHDPLALPKGWHHVVKNLAVRGWRAGGKGQTARVD